MDDLINENNDLDIFLLMCGSENSNNTFDTNEIKNLVKQVDLMHKENQLLGR